MFFNVKTSPNYGKKTLVKQYYDSSTDNVIKNRINSNMAYDGSGVSQVLLYEENNFESFFFFFFLC